MTHYNKYVQIVVGILLSLMTNCANDKDDGSKVSLRDSPNDADSVAKQDESNAPAFSAEELDALGLAGPEVVPDVYIVFVPAPKSAGLKPVEPKSDEAKKLSRETMLRQSKIALLDFAPVAASTKVKSGTKQPPQEILTADFSELPAMAVANVTATKRDQLSNKGYTFVPVVQMKPVARSELTTLGYLSAPLSMEQLTPSAQNPPGALPSPPYSSDTRPQVAIVDTAIDASTMPAARSLNQFDCATKDGTGVYTCKVGQGAMTSSHGADVTSILSDMLPGEIVFNLVNVFTTGSNAGSEPTTDSVLVMKALNQILCMKKKWNAGDRESSSPVDATCPPRNIVVVNLSLGSNNSVYPSPCDTPETSTGLGGPKGVIGELRKAGISVVGAAGNQRSKIGLSIPACISGVFSVAPQPKGGSSYRYSMAPYLKIFAPGDNVAVQGNRVASGSSFAAPFATGAVTLLATAHPDWSPQACEDRLIAMAQQAKKEARISRTESKNKKVDKSFPILWLGGDFWK